MNKRCKRCYGRGRYQIGPRVTDSVQCKDCGGTGVTTIAKLVVEAKRQSLVEATMTPPDGGQTKEGKPNMNTETDVPLSDKDVAAIHLGRVRLANNCAIKQVVIDHRTGKKGYVPINESDANARMTCEAINVLDDILEPYGYKFGDKMGAELLTTT